MVRDRFGFLVRHRSSARSPVCYAGAAKQLGELLKAVALFAVGGVAALEGRNDAGSVRLIGQLK